MAFVEIHSTTESAAEILGVVCAVIEPNPDNAEFAMVIRSDLACQGLGRILLQKMIHYCRRRGLGKLHGQTLSENRCMLGLACSLGYGPGAPEQGEVDLKLELQQA
jgi:acetyltransferase